MQNCFSFAGLNCFPNARPLFSDDLLNCGDCFSGMMCNCKIYVFLISNYFANLQFFCITECSNIEGHGPSCACDLLIK